MQTIIGFFVAAVLAISVAYAASGSVTLHPDGIGNYKQWGATGCTGGNSEWQCVSEVGTPDTSDYLRTARSKFESFTFSDSGLSNVDIDYVTFYYYTMRHNNDKNRCFESLIRTGGVNYLGGTQLCGDSTWKYITHQYTTNPATGSAWTISDLDNLEAGMHGLNPDDGGRIAQMYVLVNYTNQTAECGNNIVETGEVCDGTDLDGETCVSQGFDGGTLACNSTCDGFDTSSCFDQSCSDTDGFNLLVSGTVSGIGALGGPYSLDDYCIDTQTVLEYYCTGNTFSTFNTTCNNTNSTNGTCSLGACI